MSVALSTTALESFNPLSENTVLVPSKVAVNDVESTATAVTEPSLEVSSLVALYAEFALASSFISSASAVSAPELLFFTITITFESDEFVDSNFTTSFTKTITVIDGTIGILSPEEIKKRGVTDISQTILYDANGDPVICGLFDPRMGVLDHGKICPTDGLDNRFCRRWYCW